MCRNVEAAIEARAKVLPGDHRRELDELLFVEMPAKFVDQVIVRAVGGRGQGDRVVEDPLLQFIKGIALSVDRQICDLLVCDSVFPADGRADIQSEHTSDHRRDFELAEIL